MKHIKLYEELNTYYQSITKEEWFQYFSYRITGETAKKTDQRINFDEIDRKILKEIDKHNDYSFLPVIDCRPKGLYSENTSIEFDISTIESKVTGIIFKLKDEWFLIKISTKDLLEFSSEKHYYYKCDQIEGLIYFLKTIKNKI